MSCTNVHRLADQTSIPPFYPFNIIYREEERTTTRLSTYETLKPQNYFSDMLHVTQTLC
jgi:hypothetical protein